MLAVFAAVCALLASASRAAAAGPPIPFAENSTVRLGFLMTEHTPLGDELDSYRAAAELGVERLRAQQPALLPGITVEALYETGRLHHQGDAAVHTGLLEQRGAHVLLGPAESQTAPLAGYMASRAGLNLVSPYGRQIALSDRAEYPFVTRLFPGGDREMRAMCVLLRELGWLRVSALVAVDDLAVETLGALVAVAPEFGVELQTVVQYPASTEGDGFQLYFDLLRAHDARVIITLVPSAHIFKLYVAMHELDFLRPETQMLATSMQWRSIAGLDPKYLGFLDHAVYFGPTVNNDDPAATGPYAERLAQHLYGANHSAETPVDFTISQNVHDLALVAGHALDRYVRTRRFCAAAAAPADHANCTALEEDGDDHVTLRRMLRGVSLGLEDGIASNPIELDGSGDRVVTFKALQVRLGGALGVQVLQNGLVDAAGTTWTAESDFDWRATGGALPLDRPVERVEVEGVTDAGKAAVAVLAALGIALAAFYALATAAYRRHAIIRLSSYRVNLLSAAGGALLLAPGLVAAGDLSTAVCQASAWLLALGFTLLIGPMLAKTFRVYRFYASPDVQQVAISDGELYGVVGALLAVDAAVMLAWTLVEGGLERSVRLGGLRETDDANVVVREATEQCTSEHTAAFLTVLVLFKAAMLLVGSVLAFRVRNVRIKALNDSAWVGLTVYSTTVVALVAVPSVAVLSGSSVTSAYVLAGVASFVCVAAALTLLFFPKLLAIWTGTEAAWITETTRDVTSAETWRGTEVDAGQRGGGGDEALADPDRIELGGGVVAKHKPAGAGARTSSASTLAMEGASGGPGEGGSVRGH